MMRKSNGENERGEKGKEERRMEMKEDRRKWSVGHQSAPKIQFKTGEKLSRFRLLF